MPYFLDSSLRNGGGSGGTGDPRLAGADAKAAVSAAGAGPSLLLSSLELSDTQSLWALKTSPTSAAHFCEVVVLKLRTVQGHLAHTKQLPPLGPP